MRTYIVNQDGKRLWQFPTSKTDGAPTCFYDCQCPFPEHLRGKEVQEGKDFRFQHQVYSEIEGLKQKWWDCTLYHYNAQQNKYGRQLPTRIICLSTHKEEKCSCISENFVNADCTIHGNDIPKLEETQEELWKSLLDEYPKGHLTGTDLENVKFMAVISVCIFLKERVSITRK